jgi:hypothetical protein
LRLLFPFRKKEKTEEMGENVVIGQLGDTFPRNSAHVKIDGIGSFRLDLQAVKTKRDDLFRERQFSVFDMLSGLAENGSIDLKHHFDENLNTYVIESINGKQNWWYVAYYDGGWPEKNVFRMDHFPYKDNMHITLYQSSATDIKKIHENFATETQSRLENKGVVVQNVLIRGKRDRITFENVEVRPHNTRNDVFQDGVITALDVILSLADEKKLTYGLKWRESLGAARVVRSFWVEKINDEQSYRTCGFVYEEGYREFRYGRGNHIHLPSDVRIINSPEYMEWFWICL